MDYKKHFQSRIENEGVYVIGDITKIGKGVKRSHTLKYTFIYQGKKYNSSDKIYEKKNELIGRRYLVKILPEDPKINQILFDKRIQCDTLSAPYNGWKEIPSHFPFYQDEDGNILIKVPCIAYDSNYLEKINVEIDKIIK